MPHTNVRPDRSGPRARGHLVVAIAALSLLGTSAALDAQQPPRLTLERVASLPSLTGTAPSQPTWSPDSRRLAFLWNDEGLPFRDVWVVDVAAGTAPTRVTRLHEAASPAVDHPDPNIALRQRVNARLRTGVSAVQWSPDGRSLLFVYEGGLHRILPDGSGRERLHPGVSGVSAIEVSPNRTFVSFLSGGDVWLWNQDTGLVTRATRIGQPPVGVVPGARYLRNDVEVSSYRWSPDSRWIALQLDDRSRVRQVAIPDYLAEETTINVLRRDFPGENDHLRTIGVLSVDRGRVWHVPLPEPEARRNASYAWSPDSRLLLIDRFSEDAVHRWLTLADVTEQSVRDLWHDRRDTRTTVYWNSDWQSDGRGVLFISDMEDRHRLYGLPVTGGKATRLTDGDWSVVGAALSTSPLIVSASSKEVFFLSTQEGPYERHVYRMPQGGGPTSRVTRLRGVHQPLLSPDGSRIALLHSNDTTPPDLYVVDSRGAEPERRLTTSPPAEFNGYPWTAAEYVTFKSHVDGTMLHGRLVLPPNMDRTKKYPVIIGPVYSDTVRNQWRGTFALLQQYLAIEGGYIGFHVDIRGSVGYGRDHKERLLMDYGGIDVEDIHSGAEFLKTLPYVDPDRIGLWGSSYGGLMTAMSLFKKPGVYRAGVAGAPATNVWHATTGEVDVARRPDIHPDSYRRASVFMRGEDLRDPLMIIHGMQDDVVLFKDSVVLAEKLMMLGKDFDFVVAPSAVHGWTQKEYAAVYLLRKLVDFFDRHVGRGPTGPGTTAGPPRH
ncbi:MAG: prolyl oligopeptidase family serine peptidase [Acidobacteria bacterium]|nr:prolyl oligopeptidase family serine peptidase [Acidobacteriota bacterium]